ncbi:MAG: serine/threonine-protein phosphatase [Phycisphaerae bacterium]|nr:serine/threonine-protein phosphatase [Phycisphaerae bacterium]
MTAEAPDFPEGDRYRGEYEIELERWFRRRFGWLCVAFLIWQALAAILLALSLVVRPEDIATGDGQGPMFARAMAAVSTVSVLVVVLWFWRSVRPKIETRAEAVQAATRMILTLGAMTFLFELAILIAHPGAPMVPLASIAFWHLMASLFLPWSPRESLTPIAPLLLAWAVWYGVRGGLQGEWVSTPIHVLLAPLVLVPGLAVSQWRLTRHRRQFRTKVRKRLFASMRRELQQARIIHESLFPKPFDDGDVRFDYRYRPAHEIGGDFVHLWTDHVGVMHLTVLDVTGHGLASAMTVHRLYGEIERLRFEHPYLRPGSVLSLLNRYVTLTLAQHKIFATALLVRFDPRDGSCMYANAGHPPVFLRARNAAIRELDSTAPMLGVLQPQDFGVEDLTFTLEPGDTLIAYTDGAFEPRNRKGQKLGIAGLQASLKRNPAPPSWADFLLSLVESHSGGALDDDILIASLTFHRRRDPNRIDVLSEADTAVVSL